MLPGGPALRAARVQLGFPGAQFHPADLAGDGLGQVEELEAPDSLVRREVHAAVMQDALRGLGGGLVTRGEHHVRLGNGQADGIRRRHHCHLHDRGVLDHHGFQLEGREPVVGGFEDVVRAAHVGEDPVLVPRDHVPGVVDAVPERLIGLRGVPVVAGCQAHGTRVQTQAQFALGLAHLTGRGVDQHGLVPGERAAHGPGFHGHPGGVGDLQ